MHCDIVGGVITHFIRKCVISRSDSPATADDDCGTGRPSIRRRSGKKMPMQWDYNLKRLMMGETLGFRHQINQWKEQLSRTEN